MESLKPGAILFISCLIAFLAFEACDNYKNIEASRAKEKIIEAIEVGFKEQSPIDLKNIGGINWEKVCLISYELNGYDAAHGLDIPIKYLKLPQKSFSQIADETYTEFKGSEYGIVFWSLKQKTFVAIPLEDAAKPPAYGCHEAKDLILLNQITPEGRIITFNKKD